MRGILPALGVLFGLALPAAAGEVPLDDLARSMTITYGHSTPTRWGEHLPGITARLARRTAPAEGRAVTLTLDACDGGTDMTIIALLREYSLPATIFVTDIWLRRNAVIAKELAHDPLFTLACHGKRHKPASVAGSVAYGIAGTASVAALVEEVETNARTVARLTGKRPCWYRSGTAHYDDVALAVIHALGLGVAGYTVNADEGATLPPHEVAGRLTKAPDGAIILMHLNRPAGGTGKGLAIALPAMLEQGVTFLPLETGGLCGN